MIIDTFRRVGGLGRTFAADQSDVLATAFVNVVGPGGPVGDGLAESGFDMARSYTTAVAAGRDRNFLAAALDLDVDPRDGAPIEEPFGSGFDGGGFSWGIVLNTSDTFVYGLPPELAGYTLTVGFAEFASGVTLTGRDYALTGGVDVNIDELIATGTMADALPFLTVTAANVAAVNAGTLVPMVQLDGPFSGRDPLLHVANLSLCIGHFEFSTTKPVATRQWPRDDALGLGSAPRIHPPPRSGRVVGGFQ